MQLSWVRDLVDYHDWANRKLLGTVAGLTAEQYSRDIGGSFPTVKANLEHMLHVDALWLDRLQGAPPLSQEEVASPAVAQERWALLAHRLRDYAARLDPAGLERQFTVRFRSGQEAVHTPGEVLAHVVNHGTYHRGQVSSAVRQLGGQPVSTDMIYWFRERSGQ